MTNTNVVIFFQQPADSFKFPLKFEILKFHTQLNLFLFANFFFVDNKINLFINGHVILKIEIKVIKILLRN